MEFAIKYVSDITYMSELIPTSALKFSKKILAHLTSRDEAEFIIDISDVKALLPRWTVRAEVYGIIRDRRS